MKNMTYKQMEKQIEKINEEIKFMYAIQKEIEDREKAAICGNIINSLLAYKYYLTFEKDYDER